MYIYIRLRLVPHTNTLEMVAPKLEMWSFSIFMCVCKWIYYITTTQYTYIVTQSNNKTWHEYNRSSSNFILNIYSFFCSLMFYVFNKLCCNSKFINIYNINIVLHCCNYIFCIYKEKKNLSFVQFQMVCCNCIYIYK